jgi:hypothetical protein
VTKTLSETIFERFCAEMRIQCVRVPEEAGRTPDYVITLNGQQVIVEVKEFTPNKEEKESDRVLRERGVGNVLTETPGARVRQKIADCSAQIKARTHGRLPGLLVLFDRGRVIGHAEPYHIMVAMYGLEQIHVAVPRDPSMRPYATGMSLGPKRKMTERTNRSISAIGALFMTGPDAIYLHVYHNKFAAVPLDPDAVAAHGIPQSRLQDETPGQRARWEIIENAK